MMALGLLIGIVALLVLLVLTVLVYFYIRKKWPYRRVANEVAVIAFAFVMAFAVRLVIVLLCGLPQNTQGNIDTGIAVVLYVLYSTIGGLSFEGVDGLMELSVNGLVQAIYYGVLVYAGIVTLLILSVGLSYELYSYISIRGRRIASRYTAFYVFTDVTEESLLLAKSIKKYEQENKHKRRYVIIFSGSRLEPFDRKNALHREIMCNGYYYWSHKSTNNANPISLLKRFHFKPVYKLEQLYKKNLYIFAIKNDTNLLGAEDSNSDIVFSDIRNTLKDYQLKKMPYYDRPYGIPLVINYYVLTNKDVNYEFYITRQNDLIERQLNEMYGETDEHIAKSAEQVSKYFQVNVLNEAVMSGYDLIEQLKRKFFTQYTEQEWKEYKHFIEPNSNGVYRIAVFGFGSNSEQAMKQLYIHSMQFVDTEINGVQSRHPVRFIADIYDKNMDELSGKFLYSHPLFVAVPDCNSLQEDTKILEYEQDHPTEVFNDIVKAVGKKMSAEEVRKEMALPIVVMHNQSCFAKDFMHSMDNSFAGIYDKNAVEYRAFVIGMGNDELNITMANLLIDDFKHEIIKLQKSIAESSNKQHANGPKIIFVNIRDEKNIYRLNWSKEDKTKFEKHLLVIPFGCRTKIWTYSRFDDSNDHIYNYCYESVKNYWEQDKWLSKSGDLEEYCVCQHAITTNDKNIIKRYKKTRKDKAEEKTKNNKSNTQSNTTDGNNQAQNNNAEGNNNQNNQNTANKSNSDNNQPNILYTSHKHYEVGVEQLFSNYDDIHQVIARYLWEAKNSFEKVSNKVARMYAHNFYFEKNLREEDKGKLEHIRWDCFTIVNGFIYSNYTEKGKAKDFRKHIKEHNCLCPFILLDQNTKDFDMVNIQLANHKAIVNPAMADFKQCTDNKAQQAVVQLNTVKENANQQQNEDEQK